MAAQQAILEVCELEKSYKNNKALKGISFHVFSGEILCFLGPNGAGKSTAIHILSTALRSDRGEIKFEGEKITSSLGRYKQNLGIVPQDLAIYDEVSAEKNVRFFGALYGLKGKELAARVEEALAFVGLTERKKDKPKTFSGGMKRRLNIACAIVHKPKIIIMDEPTVGIDLQSRNHILESIKQLREDGATIVYTTHYMEEVEEISTRIMIIDQGEIIAEGTKEQLKEQLEDEKWYEIEVESYPPFIEDDLYRISGVKHVQLADRRIRISALKGIENLDKIIGLLVDHNMKILNVTTHSASLDRVFLKLTGRSLRD